MSDQALVPNAGDVGQQLALPNLAGAEFATPQHFDEMVRASFMPRVSLMAGTSGMVMEGKMSVGKFCFLRTGDDYVDLGDSFNFIPISYRFAAMRFAGADSKMEIYYNPQSPEFLQIKEESEGPDSGCNYGPQFLIWVPTVKDFATYHFGSKSARPIARDAGRLLNQNATMKAKLVQGKQTPPKKWHVPQIFPCSMQLELPDIATATAVAEKFNKPGEKEVSQKEATEPGQTPATPSGEERPR